MKPVDPSCCNPAFRLFTRPHSSSLTNKPVLTVHWLSLYRGPRLLLSTRSHVTIHGANLPLSSGVTRTRQSDLSSIATKKKTDPVIAAKHFMNVNNTTLSVSLSRYIQLSCSGGFCSEAKKKKKKYRDFVEESTWLPTCPCVCVLNKTFLGLKHIQI